MFDAAELLAAIRDVDLVVVSQVLFNTGQVLPGLPALIGAAHASGARVLLDVYHSLGVLPVDIAALDADFAIGGSYKYLRGGPGAGFMYLHPRHLDGGFSTLDIGWFAKKAPFDYVRPDPPEFAAGGDALLESTPPVLTCYQARAGQLFTAAVGVARLREYSLAQQRTLVGLLGRARRARGRRLRRSRRLCRRAQRASARVGRRARAPRRDRRLARGASFAFAPTCCRRKPSSPAPPSVWVRSRRGKRLPQPTRPIRRTPRKCRRQAGRPCARYRARP